MHSLIPRTEPTVVTPKIKIEMRNIVKIFGNHPEKALEQLHAGRNKTEILRTLACTVGLNNVSLRIPTGQIFIIMGLSGSGKSTLIRHINRLIDPTAGEVLIDGENILKFNGAHLRKLRRHKINMVFQNFGLLPHKTVLGNVSYGLWVRGEKRSMREEHARNCIAQVGLSDYINSYPDELSGGMRQRVGLARTLAMDNDIILMDEAFSALDPLNRTQMQEQLLLLQTKIRKTIVFITHDIDEALRLGDRIAILRDGELVQEGDVNEILHNPKDDHVRQFIGKQELRPTNSIN